MVERSKPIAAYRSQALRAVVREFAHDGVCGALDSKSTVLRRPRYPVDPPEENGQLSLDVWVTQFMVFPRHRPDTASAASPSRGPGAAGGGVRVGDRAGGATGLGVTSERGTPNARVLSTLVRRW
ncbi:MAG: hypothetical protein ACJ72A_16720 [Nocardioidaceae bacterium]